jgi:hypothetical protein
MQRSGVSCKTTRLNTNHPWCARGCSTAEFSASTSPPYSPDLNPIENLWTDLARRVEPFQCSSPEELQDIVAEEWKKTPKKYLRQLARSMQALSSSYRGAWRSYKVLN